jgi:pSer/pThr/pTyr-binding forkhead associated (FHA) protein
MGSDTIFIQSPIGKRLDGMIPDDDRTLVFAGKRVPLVGQLVIGRDASCDVVIENKLVSKRHAMIQKIKADYFVTDLGSTNGTFINEQRVPQDKYMKIEPGDHIKIGKIVLAFQ